MQTSAITIRYSLECDDGHYFEFPVVLDSHTLEHLFPEQGPSPEWTRLKAGQCEGCPLDAESLARCPLALSLVKLVEQSGEILSYTNVTASVESPERTVRKSTTAQKAVSSLLGLLMATSGCPLTAFLKPMARFHLPFSTREESIFRAATAYLLAQYFLYHRGKPYDIDMSGLKDAYTKLQAVNAGMAKRLRYLSEGDANVNAIALLDLLAQDIPAAIEERLSEIEYLFAPYFNPGH